MTDPNLTDVEQALKRLKKSRDDFFWSNPSVPSTPYDTEISRLESLLADGVYYEPNF